MRTEHETYMDRAHAARLIRAAQQYAIREGARQDVVETLTRDILRAVRDAVVSESLMEPAAYDIRAIGLMVGVDMPALDGEEDR